MEPIRPDDDEVRAGRGSTKLDEGVSAQRKSRAGDRTAANPKSEPPGPPSAGAGGPRKPAGKPRSPSGGSGGRGGLLLICLLIVAGAAAAGWYQQEQRIQMLEGQLEEAEYWARQSKLALARFQGDLSETGENLQEKGQSIEDRLATQNERLDTADSEIRKLWGVANDRNRKRLDDHQSRLETLRADVDAGISGREALVASLQQLETELTSSLSQARAELASSLSQARAELEEQVNSVQQTAQDNTESLAKLDSELERTLAGVNDKVESQLVRFEREQKLTIDGLESRIAALEEATESLSSSNQLDAVRSDLSELEQTVSVIDSSRSQLTSRLVRLSEEVSALRARISGQ